MKTKLSIAAVALAAAALIGGAAWACVPGASITINPGTGGPGTTVGVSGTTFDPQGSLVNIYWDGTAGQLVGTVPVQADRTFSFSFNVPNNATAGSHVVSATQLDRNGLAYNPVNRAFRVAGTRAPNTPNLQGPAQPLPVDGVTQPAPAPQPRTAPAPAPVAPAAGPAAAPPGQPAAPQAGTPGSPGVGAQTPGPPATPTADQGATAQQPAGSQEAFRTPVPAPAPAGATEAVASSGGAPAWLLIPLAVLSLGFLGAGAGIFARERKRVRVQA